MKRIVSRANATFKSLRALKDSARARRAQGQTLLDGAHLVRAYLASVGQPRLAAVSSDACETAEIADLLRMLDSTRVICFSAPLFAQVTPVDNATGILALVDIAKPPGTCVPAGFVILLDRIQDPGNVGAIIRSAAGAGADALILGQGCADPWSPRALRAAMGATFSLAIHADCDLGRYAGRFEGKVVATSGRGGVPPSDIDLTGPVAMIFGSEGAGLSPPLTEIATITASIPLADPIESLNVGAAAAVLMFERVRQLGAKSR